MAQVEMRVDLSSVLNAALEENTEKIIASGRELLQDTNSPDVLLGRLGMIAVHGDKDGHPSSTLGTAAMLSRLIHFMPEPVNSTIPVKERALPIFVQAVKTASAALRAGSKVEPSYPEPLFPSDLGEKETVNEAMRKAVHNNDTSGVERLLFGLYGSGADYRTMEARIVESIADTFQDGGHPMIFAVRGFQLLDAVEWGDRVPNILHWLTPHLPLSPTGNEPTWIKTVRTFASKPENSMKSVRTRLSTPKDENALELYKLLSSNVDTTQVCQGVYDTVIKKEVSPRAAASVIALAAADLLCTLDNVDHQQYLAIAHGLLYAAAVRQMMRRVQDVEILPSLYTAAAYINALYQEVSSSPMQQTEPTPAGTIPGGGFIAGSQLETLQDQLKSRDFAGALATAQRYLKVGHDPRALFGAIAIAAGHVDATQDQGQTLQVVQAAAEEYMAWPKALAQTNTDAFIHVALHAIISGPQDPKVAQL
ncbi:hypothetical protein [Ktedonospora formicarum]|uniref:Uncharacterized protein n=1 Tax=Ktedonospora formicarum TaxID=2778364 RepID=A0A8J3MRW8_9CHLR|nr:hypothetical protein [Ktedonospora formicarum]GHO45460.1 hypothetical protein KSX_36230 [Ktedonospora formicarum]